MVDFSKPLTKKEVFSQDFYEFTYFSYTNGCFCKISLDSDYVWNCYISYQKLGSLKKDFGGFSDYIHALLSYNK